MRFTTTSKDYITGQQAGVSFMTYHSDKKTSTLEAMSSSTLKFDDGKTIGQVYEEVGEVIKAVKKEVKGQGLAKGEINNLTRERLATKGERYVALFTMRDKIKLSKTMVYEVKLRIVEDKLLVALLSYELLKEVNDSNIDNILIDTMNYDLKGKKSDVVISLEDFNTGLDKSDTSKVVANDTKLEPYFTKILSEMSKDIASGGGIKTIVDKHKSIHDREVERANGVIKDYMLLEGITVK